MYTLMLYSLKVGACLAVFYLFFKLLLSRETFHRLNRIVVLAAMVLSFVLPLCVITVYRELPAMPELPVTEEAGYAPSAEPESLLVLRPAQVPILGVLLVVGQIEPAAVAQFHLCGQRSRKIDIPVAVYADRPALGVRRGRTAVRFVPDNEFHCK